MKTLRQSNKGETGRKKKPDYSSITVVPGFYIEKDPRAVLREARESGSLDVARRWLAKRDRQLKGQSEKTS